MRGEVDRAIEYLERGLEISTKINTVFNLIFGNYFRGWIAMEQGEYEVALASFQASHGAAAPLEQFMPMMYVMALSGEGSVYTAVSPALGDKAHEFHDKALELLGEPTGVPGGGTAFPEIGFAALARGDLALAQDLFEKGANVPSILRNVMRPRSYAGMALALVAQGQPDAAEPYIKQAREFLEARGPKNFEPLVALAAGRVAWARGEADQALREFTRAEYYASEMNFRPYLWQAHARAAEVLDAQGQPDQAAARREQARAAINEIAVRLTDESWRKLFLENALGQLS
jgi:tetratricopeptide (TPR) repeat protein